MLTVDKHQVGTNTEITFLGNFKLKYANLNVYLIAVKIRLFQGVQIFTNLNKEIELMILSN